MTPTPSQTPTGLFECDNCGYKPSMDEVLLHKGDCPKCKDTVIAFTVDAAERITQLERELGEALNKLESYSDDVALMDNLRQQLSEALAAKDKAEAAEKPTQ